jgi:hypothetical protein
MRRLLREPLIHFFLLGAVLFAAYDLLSPEQLAQPQRILVTPGQIEHLATSFSATWQRPPTRTELQQLVDQYVREEILSREAVKLGLDQNDSVIRRRLQQKMEFVSEDLFTNTEPTDAELTAYLAEHPEDFRQEGRVSFRQVFLSADKRGEHLQGDAAELLSELKTLGPAADVSALGDPTLLPPAMTDEPPGRVESTFGRDFASGLAGADTGTWIGPIRSGLGLHLVFIEQRESSRLPELAEVREAVLREWGNARRVEARHQFYDDLLKQYQVSVEWPAPQRANRTASR